MKLTSSQIHEFYDTGFLVLEDMFSSGEVAAIKSSFEVLAKRALTQSTTFVDQGTQYVVNGNRVDRVVWCAGAQPQLLNFAHSRNILAPVCQILGSHEVNHLICQAHFKFPGDGVSFPWHQDSEHRKYGSPYWKDINGKGSYVQSILAIDDITPDNGPIHFVPKSCQSGHLFLERHQEARSTFDHSKFVSPCLRAGSMVFFGPYTVHGSQENQSSGPRRVFINGFSYPGANSFSYPGCDTGLPVRCCSGD